MDNKYLAELTRRLGEDGISTGETISHLPILLHGQVTMNVTQDQPGRNWRANGREHSIPEIQSYINWRTGEKGIDGMPLSDQILYSTLAHRFERTGRGVYRDPSVGIQRDVTTWTETDQLLYGLKRVDEELSEAFTRNYSDLPCSSGKLQELFAIMIQLRSLIRQARELAASETPVMEAKQASAPAPPDQTLKSTGGDDGQGEPEKWPRMGMKL